MYMFFLLSLVLINSRAQRSWRRKCLFLVTAFNTHERKSRKEIHEVTWQQELKQRLQRKDAYWLALHGLPILLSFTVLDHLSMPPLRVGWALPDRSLLTKMPYRFAYRQWSRNNYLFKIPSSETTLTYQADKRNKNKQIIKPKP